MSKVVLISGGTRGIGRAIAETFLGQGYAVVVTYRENEGAAKLFEQDATQRGSLHVLQSDICSDRDIDALVKFLDERYGHLDALINNAGRVIGPSDLLHITRDSFVETLQTNLVGPWLLTQRALPLMNNVRDSVVVFIGSTYGIIGDPDVIAYSSAKAGLIQLTRAAAKALAPHIRVNAILPGNIDTDMTRSGGPQFVEQIIEETPLKRIGSVNEIAELVKFLVSDACPFITGQTIIVDGGHILR